MLNGVALFFIFFLMIAFAAVIVVVGSLPGKIARRRGHPHPDAVNAASWIGLATGVFWPVAFIWAFLPVPGPRRDVPAEKADPSVDLANIQERLAALETAMEQIRSRAKEDVS